MRELTVTMSSSALFGLALLVSVASCTAASSDGTPSKSSAPTTASAVEKPSATPTRAAAAVRAPVLANPTPLSPVADGHEVAILAGGCFWGMEELLRRIDGVVSTEVGYAGGSTSTPTYEDVKKGTSGHAESVRVVFDPTRLSYDDLLVKWFFRMHDPTTLNQQGNDIGTQYRSAIFVTSPEQRTVAEDVKRRANESGVWKKPVVTEIADAGPFTLAEDYHQDYLQRIPDGYTCHFMRNDISF